MSNRLADKAAVVVGAGQMAGSGMGNGRAAAILYAREGARVLCVDRDLEAARETVAHISQEGGRAWACQADIAGEGGCAELVAHAGAKLGRIDVLHNNVGITRGDASVELLPASAWDTILGANLKGMWLTLKHALPVMRRQGGGAIVNISSVGAVIAADSIAYEVSKAGVNKLTTSVAAVNARYGIRCNAVMPGLIDTPMATELARARGESPDDSRDARNVRVPLGEMGTAWDVAHAALFLASDEAKYITGVVLAVDGGLSNCRYFGKAGTSQ